MTHITKLCETKCSLKFLTTPELLFWCQLFFVSCLQPAYSVTFHSTAARPCLFAPCNLIDMLENSSFSFVGFKVHLKFTSHFILPIPALPEKPYRPNRMDNATAPGGVLHYWPLPTCVLRYELTWLKTSDQANSDCGSMQGTVAASTKV